MIIQKYKLNLVPGGEPVIVRASQYDNLTRVITFALFKDKDIFVVPDGCKVYVLGTKEDKTGYFYECTVEHNYVAFYMREQMTVLPGKHEAEIRIVDEENHILNSANFIVDIEEAAFKDDTIISETDIPLLEEILEHIDAIYSVDNILQGGSEGQVLTKISNEDGDVEWKNLPTIPDKTSELENDSGFITKEVDDLTYYRTSADQDIIDSGKASINDIVVEEGLIINSIQQNNCIAGSKAYTITEVKSNLKTFVFETVEGLSAYLEGNLYIYDGYKDTNIMQFGRILNISGNEVTFDTAIIWDGNLNLQNSYIWFTNHPELGNAVIGIGATAFGYGTKAAQIGSNSVGYETTALGKYSHAEGFRTVADFCSHAEGRSSIAKGLYSHAQGDTTEAIGDYSFTSGYQSKANGRTSTALNEQCIANGRAAVASGYRTEANATTSFAGGTTSKANHTTSFAFGTRAVTSRQDQAVFGRDNADDPNALFIIGNGSQNNKRNLFEVTDIANVPGIKVGNTSLSETQLQNLLSLVVPIKVIDLNEYYMEFEEPAKYIQGIYNMITNCYQNNKAIIICNYYIQDGMTNTVKPGATMITYCPNYVVAGHDNLEHDCYFCWFAHSVYENSVNFIITDDDYVDYMVV